jgi:hypothetical protein
MGKLEVSREYVNANNVVGGRAIDDGQGARRVTVDKYAVGIVVREDMVEGNFGRANRVRVRRDCRDSGRFKIPDRAIGDRQRPARVEQDAVLCGLEPIEGQMTEVDGIVWPGVDGDRNRAAGAVDAGAVDPGEADRFADGRAAIIRGIERFYFTASIGLADRELEGAASGSGRGASAGVRLSLTPLISGSAASLRGPSKNTQKHKGLCRSSLRNVRNSGRTPIQREEQHAQLRTKEQFKGSGAIRASNP